MDRVLALTSELYWDAGEVKGWGVRNKNARSIGVPACCIWPETCHSALPASDRGT